MIYLPIIGAVFLGSGTILEKYVLKIKKMDIKLYQVVSFLAIVLAMLPFLYFFWRVDSGALATKNIIIFSLIILLAILANILFFYSLKGEKVVKLEPASALEQLFVIILAIIFGLFFDGVYNRNINIIIPALVAGFALFFSHFDKNKIKFNKYFIANVFASFFFALELVISKLILQFYSPISFYFIRCLAIFVFSLIIFRPDFGKLDGKISWQIFITGIIWSVYRVIIYYGYQTLGIVFTTLILMLGPVFIYIFAHFFLKEKMSWKNFVASIVIVASVAYVLIR